MSAHVAKYLLLQILLGIAIYISDQQGWLSYIFDNDQTYISAGIAVLFLFGLLQTLFKRWWWAQWISNMLVMLGMTGTVVGFIIALSGVDSTQAGDLNAVVPMVTTLIEGMFTALGTTLVGLLGFIWLRLNLALLAGKDI